MKYLKSEKIYGIVFVEEGVNGGIIQIVLGTWERFCVLFCSFIAIKNKDSMCEGILWDS